MAAQPDVMRKSVGLFSGREADSTSANPTTLSCSTTFQICRGVGRGASEWMVFGIARMTPQPRRVVAPLIRRAALAAALAPATVFWVIGPTPMQNGDANAASSTWDYSQDGP